MGSMHALNHDMEMTMKLASIAAAAATLVAAPVFAQGTTPKTDVPPALAKQAKISLDSARAIAMRRLPKASIESQELEREKGRLIYSFDMKTTGKAGVDEVNVNAKTGAIVEVGHETPKAEQNEAKSEKKKP
jgi:uncharacterized membrane protein YkoI